MLKKILVAFDGSDYAVEAFKNGIELATVTKAELFVLAAIIPAICVP